MNPIAAFKALSMGKKIGGAVLLALAIGAAIFTFIKVQDAKHENTIEVAKDAGAAEALKAGQDLTLEQIGEANEAGNEIRNDVGYSRFCQCVRSATASTASNCDKHLKDEHLFNRPEDRGKICATVRQDE